MRYINRAAEERILGTGVYNFQSFALSKCEVTFEEYAPFAAATGRRTNDAGRGRGSRPVINVSWDDAVAYTEWLSEQTGKRYRLPSEAEWEYAACLQRGAPRRQARAGTTTKYSWGKKIGRNLANCNGCGSRWDDEKTAPVGSFPANAWGLHDMHGNVWEWVQDWLERQLPGSACGRVGLGERRLWASRVARRLVAHRSEGPPRRDPLLVPLRLSVQFLRFPYCPDAYPLNLYVFTSWGVQGGSAPLAFFPNWRPILSEASPLQPRVRGVDRSRETGPALESHFRFLAWLVPTVERFPRSQKFLLGDRIQTSALDVLERLIEATYTRRRGDALAGANLGIEKLRFLCRLARDLRYLDHRRYEHAARSLDETGRLVGPYPHPYPLPH